MCFTISLIYYYHYSSLFLLHYVLIFLQKPLGIVGPGGAGCCFILCWETLIWSRSESTTSPRLRCYRHPRLPSQIWWWGCGSWAHKRRVAKQRHSHCQRSQPHQQWTVKQNIYIDSDLENTARNPKLYVCPLVEDLFVVKGGLCSFQQVRLSFVTKSLVLTSDWYNLVNVFKATSLSTQIVVFIFSNLVIWYMEIVISRTRDWL